MSDDTKAAPSLADRYERNLAEPPWLGSPSALEEEVLAALRAVEAVRARQPRCLVCDRTQYGHESPYAYTQKHGHAFVATPFGGAMSAVNEARKTLLLMELTGNEGGLAYDTIHNLLAHIKRLEAENAALKKAKERVLSICRNEYDCYTWCDDFGHWVHVESIVTSLLCMCNEHYGHDEDCPSAAIAQTDERKEETK